MGPIAGRTRERNDYEATKKGGVNQGLGGLRLLDSVNGYSVKGAHTSFNIEYDII